MSSGHLVGKRFGPGWVLLAAAVALLATTPRAARAQTETVLYSFTGGADGAHPQTSLILDSKGNLYGTTSLGGASGYGTVFEVTPSGIEKVLYSFNVIPDGHYPYAGLIRDEVGNLYGTTGYGGLYGQGSVFELTPAGTETVLHSFGGAGDGAHTSTGLVRDAAGNLYGTTQYGGTYGVGTVFEVTPAGTETVLYNFTGGTDGDQPYGSLVLDKNGNLYGTTLLYQGGGGIVFELTPSGTEIVRHRFKGKADGAWPFAGLLWDSNGNLYGTTRIEGPQGYGTVFELEPRGKETVLYSFTGGTDGRWPLYTLVRDAAGNLYGTTPKGGAYGKGTVFEITASGTEKLLYSFTGRADGANPYGGLVLDSQGNLYGTTWAGGAYRKGAVFEVIP